MLLDHSVSLLYRPKHLKRLINNTATLKDVQNIAEDDTFDDEVKAMNVYVSLFLFIMMKNCSSQLLLKFIVPFLLVLIVGFRYYYHSFSMFIELFDEQYSDVD